MKKAGGSVANLSVVLQANDSQQGDKASSTGMQNTIHLTKRIRNRFNML